MTSSQKLQVTLAIIKPHAVKNPVALSFIRNVLKNSFIVVKTKRITLDQKAAGDFYQEHAGKFFYNRLVTFMTSGSLDLHILGHVNAVQLWRRMLGPTSVYKAQFLEPYCLRGMFGISDTRNVAHGSVAECHPRYLTLKMIINAIHVPQPREIKHFFPDFSFNTWYNSEEERYRKGPIIFNDYLFQHVRRL
ncbi:nucleoside diphosphate kinase domain-containing protein [Phthorimaea operculella]|nr:nucleoside diphosphate kinase domain-containing protein [Phthorimaea operculella]